jgi:hypothetical protein
MKSKRWFNPLLLPFLEDKEARLAKSIGADEPNKPSRKILRTAVFPNSFASADTCGNCAYNFSNSCIFIRNCVQR